MSAHSQREQKEANVLLGYFKFCSCFQMLYIGKTKENITKLFCRYSSGQSHTHCIFWNKISSRKYSTKPFSLFALGLGQ